MPTASAGIIRALAVPISLGTGMLNRRAAWMTSRIGRLWRHKSGAQNRK